MLCLRSLIANGDDNKALIYNTLFLTSSFLMIFINHSTSECFLVMMKVVKTVNYLSMVYVQRNVVSDILSQYAKAVSPIDLQNEKYAARDEYFLH